MSRTFPESDVSGPFTNEIEGPLSPANIHPTLLLDDPYPVLPPAEQPVLNLQPDQLDLPAETPLNDTRQTSSESQTFRARILDPRTADPQQLAEGYLDLLQDYNEVLNANIRLLLRCQRLAETNMQLRSGYHTFLDGLDDLYSATYPILEGNRNVSVGPRASFTVIPVAGSIPADIPEAQFGGERYRSS
ncbi:hypothetical protein DFH09DRAFT_1193960 [Mycena vulgaris]|nr:hypothetical protein DFH09DRAFT_1193960 [Mycena vulgaris]